MAKKVTLKSLQNRVTKELVIDMQYDYLSIKIGNTQIARLCRDMSEISCGVDQLYNLPGNDVLKKASSFIEGDSLSFYKDLLKYSLNEYLNVAGDGTDENLSRSAFFIISNTTFQQNIIINEILDSICQNKSKVRTNPNSGNKIKVWIF